MKENYPSILMQVFPEVFILSRQGHFSGLLHEIYIKAQICIRPIVEMKYWQYLCYINNINNYFFT